MDDRKRVLVTGAAGVIGTAVCKALKDAGHFVRGLDLRETPLADENVVGTVADMEAVKRAMAGMTTLVHLAATTDDADFFEMLLAPNVVGVVNVLEAARLAGVKRVSLASSMQVVSGIWKRARSVVRAEDGTAPTNGYAATKIFAEAMGRVYWAKHQLEVVCPRIGWLPRHKEDARQIARRHAQKVYLSHDDAGRFYRCFVEAEKIGGAEPGYAVVFLASKRAAPEGPDLEGARQAVGYEPHDFFPAGIPWNIDE